tara:strand:- start:740 stop:1342 length:603 start_codon:yes stop_codon:yes gene_type:complete
LTELYLYSEKPIDNIIKEVFVDFKIHTASQELIKKDHFINKNILLVLNVNLPTNLSDFFFLKNNVVIFFLNHNNLDKKKYLNTKIFCGHTNINKFTDEAITFFRSKSFTYKDVKIREEKIINLKTKKEAFLTSSEKDILILLFERKKIQKNFLLEDVLKLRRDTETKTIESHLTRIRKKLISINSQIEIISKEKTVFLID